MIRTSERRFWAWYAAAWLLPFATYVVAFSSQAKTSLRVMAVAALLNVLPDALLGVGAVVVCRRLWSRDDRRGVAARLVAAGIAFVVFAAASKVGLAIGVARLDGRRVDLASFDLVLVLWQAFFSLLTFAVLTSVTYGAATAARLRREEARRSEADLLRVRSELKALRAQLNPHFLFNTLHSVRALIGENAAAAEEALEELGDLLRYPLRIQDSADDGVLFVEEWEFVRAYLALEKIRLGDRLRVEEDVSEDALPCVVPAFVLQPLVENAIRHGIGARESGGTIGIRAHLDGDALRLEVRDDGPGANGVATKGTGKGLDLVRQRLRALYGDAGKVEVASSGAGFSVTLHVPRASDAA